MDPIEVLQKAGSYMPSTIDTDEEKMKWLSGAFVGKTVEQVQQEADTNPVFGIDANNYQHYAARAIQERQDLRTEMGADPLSSMDQVAISDAYRQLSGVQPIFYDVGPGGAVPKDLFRESRIKRNEDSGWHNFKTNIANTVMSGAGGITQLGAKISDSVGVTEDATSYWQSEMEEVERILSPQGGASGMAGKVAGNIMFALMVGGVGGSSGTAASGGWKTALGGIMREGLGVGLAFGAAETGRRYGDIEARRESGQEIGTLDGLTYAVGGGLIEAATEAFGWGLAKGVGGTLLKSLPGLRHAIGKGGVEAGINWFNHSVMRPVVSGAIPGATEEALATFGQNVLDRVTGVVSAEEQGEYGVLSNVGQSALMGAITPTAMGSVQAAGQAFTKGGQQQIAAAEGELQAAQEQETLGKVEQELGTIPSERTSEEIVEGLELRREWVRDNLTMEVAAKQEVYKDLDAQIEAVKENKLDQVPLQTTQKVETTEDFIEASKNNDMAVYRETTPDERKTARSTIKGMKRHVSNYFQGQQRVERMMDKLDNGTEGPNYQMYKDTKSAAIQTRQKINNVTSEFVESVRGLIPGGESNSAVAKFLNTRTDIPGTKKSLTPGQKVGVYLLSQNKNGAHHLKYGNKYSDNTVQKVIESMTPEELQMASVMQNRYEGQFADIAAAYKEHTGKELNREEGYSPIVIRKSAMTRDDNFIESLVSGPGGAKAGPEKGFTEARKAGARQPVELDAFSNMMYNISRTERYKNMVPLITKHGKTINNPEYKAAVDKATGGMGSKILSKWFGDTVRGTPKQDHTFLSRVIDTLRQRGVVASLGLNLVSSVKQTNSALIGMAYSPKMIPTMMKNVSVGVTPKGFKEIENFVDDRTDLLKDRSIERELRTLADQQTATRKISKRTTVSEKSMALLKFMDKHTVYPLWKSYYEVGLQEGKNEQESAEFADRYITRTQPMANPEDLPHYFRGGSLEKLFTTFQNQLNQNLNFWAHDVVGEYKTGKIDKKMVAYRTLMSYMLPAMLMGMMSRGFDPPDDTEEWSKDMISYPTSTMFLFGQMADSAIKGFDRASISDTLPNELSRAAGEFSQDNPRYAQVLKHLARATGAGLGLPTSQPIRTVEGAIDLASGETEDPRRLVWSEYALREQE